MFVFDELNIFVWEINKIIVLVIIEYVSFNFNLFLEKFRKFLKLYLKFVFMCFVVILIIYLIFLDREELKRFFLSNLFCFLKLEEFWNF